MLTFKCVVLAFPILMTTSIFETLLLWNCLAFYEVVVNKIIETPLVACHQHSGTFFHVWSHVLNPCHDYIEKQS